VCVGHVQRVISSTAEHNNLSLYTGCSFPTGYTSYKINCNINLLIYSRIVKGKVCKARVHGVWQSCMINRSRRYAKVGEDRETDCQVACLREEQNVDLGIVYWVLRWCPTS